jgi:hypothetical protein
MDELPELTNDADVDALMARVRARVQPPSQPGSQQTTPAALSGSALAEFLAAQQEFAAAMVRAMTVIADTFEELQADAERPRSETAGDTAKPAKAMRPSRRTGGSRASRR